MTIFDDAAKACFAAFLLLTLSGCDKPGGHQKHRQAESGDAVQVQSLDVYVENDRLHLLTGEYQPKEKMRTLWYRQSADGGSTWSTPARVDAGSSPVHEFGRGNDAQIAASRDRIMAAWTTVGTGWGNSGPLVTAVSDKGKPWREHSNPADDNGTGGHAFIDLEADNDGAFHIVWLDERRGAQGLRHSRTAEAGASPWLANATVDAKTCECCWNTLLSTGKTMYTLYRDLSPRDMRLVSSTNGGETWREIGPVGAFNWNIDACPHAGGALAITSQRSELHALVWTGRDNASGVYHLASADAGESWTKPVRMGGETAKHSGLAAGQTGTLAAVWDERDEHVSAIVGSLSEDGGLNWSAPRRLSDAGANASHPRIVATRWGFRVFWTEARRGESQIWKMAVF